MKTAYPVHKIARMTEKQGKKLERASKEATKSEKKEISEAEIIRRLVDKHL
jgi:hypothetical protein